MITVLHATAIKVPHLHKTAYSSYRNTKRVMTNTHTKLPETMHTQSASVCVDYRLLGTALLHSTDRTELLTPALYNSLVFVQLTLHKGGGGLD
jgi:hypothetical protein